MTDNDLYDSVGADGLVAWWDCSLVSGLAGTGKRVWHWHQSPVPGFEIEGGVNFLS